MSGLRSIFGKISDCRQLRNFLAKHLLRSNIQQAAGPRIQKITDSILVFSQKCQQHAETYSGPCQTSKIKLFAKGFSMNTPMTCKFKKKILNYYLILFIKLDIVYINLCGCYFLMFGDKCLQLTIIGKVKNTEWL